MRIPEIVLGFLLATVLWTGLVVLVDGPGDFAAWLHKWQTLAGAIVASIVATTAATIAFHNTTRSIRNAEKLETWRRKRKHAALRAVLACVDRLLADQSQTVRRI